MTTYTYRDEGCDRCGSEYVDVVQYEGNRYFPKPTPVQHLCCFCYETQLGSILEYPEQYPGLATLTAGLIQSLNILKKEVSK